MIKTIYTLTRRLLGLLLLLGHRPQHVAFIMDGNRRFANKEHIDKIGGHKKGYKKMIDVIHWCLELGVPAISVYAFSIDNFKRPQHEVSSLMQLAEDKYKELAQENGLAEREGVEMRILGDLNLAPRSVQGAAARLTQATTKLKNKRAILNICFSYTASEELVQAISAIQDAVSTGQLIESDICPHLLDSCMYTTSDCPPVDLLIRTSGETRLSDFMLWQSRNAHLAFVDRLWPDLGYLDFAKCILGYQRTAHVQQELRGMCIDAASENIWTSGMLRGLKESVGPVAGSAPLDAAKMYQVAVVKPRRPPGKGVFSSVS
ncbi:hypothetical protein CEUSTIGMA_g3456.t1 [Chlamydomonas eustigma]|uniref:Alkyl transferase n=1 Tax=Chlamydomonas eustigma TaxID=1157962 RepID=A0A250WYU4_9CHLO|nr:hypothetical protein CEUSTIGMA_g3456.t1 [Chlamydomonas eustigma]|eukprot:GAX76013.1 hypothetical protein CEUSTIGMA_g3456.t1 [Chlamydomonas eustigma]